ncbi:hypothetical protein D9611_001004 [Ephemerocybe angulata]|uniref:F-box domain-containing protein n=1 Tax=Ephemerocybe angulata TaxID=980116 RepID=A0A8H5BPM2_9AGAR|nr:hypothetical protein D9611_001004 [Tulosesus angulatus]
MPPHRTPSHAAHMDAMNTLYDFVNSNNPPHHEARTLVHSVIDDISSQIGALMKEVELLQFERDKLRAVVSSLRVMPLELLSEIFLLAAFAGGNTASRETVGSLQGVCRRWRDIALRTHGLWTEAIVSSAPHSNPGHTTLIDKEPSVEDPYHEVEFKKITSWLNRAASLPKSVGYCVTRTCSCAAGEECIARSPTLEKLLKHGPRLDHVSLTMPTAACFRSWIDSLITEEESPPSSWLTLRSLKLDITEGNVQFWNDANDPARSVFALLPPVTSLGLCLPTSLPVLLVRPIHIPNAILAGLTVLSVKWDWAGSSLFKLLAVCTHLEILSVDLGNGDPFQTDDSTHTLSRLRVTPLAMSSLQEFYLRDGSFRILEFIRLPALSVLDMELDVDGEETITASGVLGSFLTSSNLLGTIKKIRLCGLIGTGGIVTLSLPVRR